MSVRYALVCDREGCLSTFIAVDVVYVDSVAQSSWRNGWVSEYNGSWLNYCPKHTART